MVHGPGVQAVGHGRGGGVRLCEVRRPHLHVHLAVALQPRQVAGQPGDDVRRPGHQHHHGELPVQVEHAAVRHVAAALQHVASHGVHEPRAVRPDGGEHGMVGGDHVCERTGNRRRDATAERDAVE